MISLRSRSPFPLMGKVWRQCLSSRRKTYLRPILNIVRVEIATTEVSLDAWHGSRGTAFSSDNRHVVIQIAHHDVRFSGTAKLFDLSNGETALLRERPVRYPVSQPSRCSFTVTS